MVKILRIFLVSVSTALAAAACSAPGDNQNGEANPDAYVFNASEFNRTSKTFAKDPTKIDSVTICYNKFGTKPAIVANMATAECQKFNRNAEFVRQSLSVCPLFTPIAAIYNCVGGNK